MAKGRAEGYDRIEARATGSRRGRRCDGETIFLFLGQQGRRQGGNKVRMPYPHGRLDPATNNTYADFLKTKPSIFHKAEEPLDAVD